MYFFVCVMLLLYVVVTGVITIMVIIDNYDDKDKQCHNKDEAVQHNNINANAH